MQWLSRGIARVQFIGRRASWRGWNTSRQIGRAAGGVGDFDFGVRVIVDMLIRSIAGGRMWWA